MASNPISLGEFIIQEQEKFPNASGDLSRILSSIKAAAKRVNYRILQASLHGNTPLQQTQNNIHGESQTPLDVYADQIFIDSSRARREVCALGSEEQDDWIHFSDPEHNQSKYVLLLDPLDGSSNADVNVSVGTIFSIYKRISPIGSPAQLEDVLQPGRAQIAAGYILYGSSTMLVMTTGNGVNGFTLDPSLGSFYLSHPQMKFPDKGRIYSINEGNYWHFPEPIKQLIKSYQQIDPKNDRPFTSRYIGSLVADFHRNLLKGGIYLYPQGTKAPQGKLRLQYECNPIAFLAEQAGGQATDGKQAILDLKPQELHQRTPFFVGNTEMIEELHRCLQAGFS